MVVRQGAQVDYGVVAVDRHLKSEEFKALVGLTGQFLYDVVIVEERTLAIVQGIQFPEPYAIPVGLTGIGVLGVGIPFGCGGEFTVCIHRPKSTV